MPQQVRYRLTDADANITKDVAFGSTWRDTFKYQCPDGTEIVLNADPRNSDIFSLHAEDSADVEYVAPDALVQIEVRDASEQSKINIYGPANYKSSKEFQDVGSMAKLRLDVPVRVKARSFIVFMTKDSTGMDSASIANSYCRLLTNKIA